jgi:hypothetical protein
MAGSQPDFELFSRHSSVSRENGSSSQETSATTQPLVSDFDWVVVLSCIVIALDQSNHILKILSLIVVQILRNRDILFMGSYPVSSGQRWSWFAVHVSFRRLGDGRLYCRTGYSQCKTRSSFGGSEYGIDRRDVTRHWGYTQWLVHAECRRTLRYNGCHHGRRLVLVFYGQSSCFH